VSRALLDINVLLALLDVDHVDHSRALRQLEREVGSEGRHARAPRTGS
jgi:predicted nucleic acid-binding protein